MTPKPVMKPLLKELRQSYQFAIDQGLKTLKIQFLQQYHQHKYAFSLRRLEIRFVTDILSPPWHKKPRLRLAKAIGAHPNQLARIRNEVQLILKGKKEKVIASRSPQELQQRASGPFFETEAYVFYLDWLEEANFPLTLPEQVFWQASFTPLEWLGTEKQMRCLYDLLVLEALIGVETSFEKFYGHFRRSTEAIKPIRWQASIILLIYLFEQLHLHHFIPERNHLYLASLLPLHFLDQQNQPLKNKSLVVSRSRSYKAPRYSERIDAIIAAMLKC